MKQDDHKIDKNRRNFIQGAAGAGVGTALAAALPGAAMASEQSVEDKKPQGYRLTQHILEYYKTAAS